jgi:predicted transcriptional regulator
MKQTNVAPILGITQTAVSKYVGNVRGQAIRIDHDRRIRNMMDDIALKIANQKVKTPQTTLGFCVVCKAVRESRLMCEMCGRTDPTLDIKACTICI